MKLDSLTRAIENAGASPCDKFACDKRMACSERKLACTAFVHYVRTGKARSPKMHIPLRITKEDQPFYMGKAEPTRNLFEVVDAMDDREDAIYDAEDVIAEAVLNRLDLEVAFSGEAQ